MDFVTEKARELPVTAECDVFVAGGGIAGAAAALAAARGGAKVILCERECMLGGLGTLGIVTVYLPPVSYTHLHIGDCSLNIFKLFLFARQIHQDFIPMARQKVLNPFTL